MEEYIPVTWTSESLSIDKIQSMIQNDQSVADELDARPRGVIGYSELTMYASNLGGNYSSGYRDYPNSVSLPNSPNLDPSMKEWKRVVDNWNINPNGLSATVNVEQGRMIHIELYIPLLVHSNPSASSTDVSELASWPIQGFKIVRDGVDISGESMMDIWTSRSSATDNYISLSMRSFYFDCFDLSPSAGPHTYEIMWKSEQGLHLAIWEQNRHTFGTLPDAVNEPDQMTYVSSNATTLSFTTGRYNISDFTLPSNLAQKYTTTADSTTVYNADATYSPLQMWNNNSTADAPFAGAVPTAQMIVTDCGAASAMIYYKEDGAVVQEAINADPTA